MRFVLVSLVVLWLAVVGCGARPSEPALSAASVALADLLEREWELRLEASPLFATSTGDHRYDDRLPDLRPEALAEVAEQQTSMLTELEALDSAAFSPHERVDLAILERDLRRFVSEHEFAAHEMPLNADSGFHTSFARLDRSMPFETIENYENYLSRLRAAPVYFAAQIGHMRSGLERGFSQPLETLTGYETTMDQHLVERAEDSVFWTPFESFPVGVPVSEHERLRGDGRRAILDGAVPAYAALLDFWLGEYLAGTRRTLGASELPRGREYYAAQIRWFTTLDLDAQAIHEIGLEEVARIRSEMNEVLEEVGYGGRFAAFLEFLRTDPRFYPKTADELMREAAYITKRMDGKLPQLFGRLPRLPYTVEPVPDHMAPKYTAGRYVSAPAGGTEPGIYWVNTYNLPSRQLYSLESLSFHEAVPGHHLQIALAHELGELAPQRRFAEITAFTEGWGLYAERLGAEVGFYKDPYSRFGRLSYEMWRACRLVVDTGVHEMGWTRDQMIDFMAASTALSLHEIETETDRYITWPGQALGYKMGEITIRELRAEAEESLGPAFDVRAFHDAVLRNGPVPLTVLREQVGELFASTR